MFIKDIKKCEEIIAGDDRILRELLNDLIFLCIVDPAWKSEDEALVE